jgi:Tfp pilus tip-associated adhesin PilY1
MYSGPHYLEKTQNSHREDLLGYRTAEAAVDLQHPAAVAEQSGLAILEQEEPRSGVDKSSIADANRTSYETSFYKAQSAVARGRGRLERVQLLMQCGERVVRIIER